MAGDAVRSIPADGNCLRRSCCEPATVVREIGPFVLIDVEGRGLRCCLPEYLVAESRWGEWSRLMAMKS